MRGVALGMAIAGGVVGILFGLLAMLIGGTANAFEEGSGDTVVWLGVSAIASSVVGILAGGLYFGKKRPKLMVLILLVASIWHLVSISVFGIPGFIFLLLATIFAWFGRPKEEPQATASASTG